MSEKKAKQKRKEKQLQADEAISAAMAEVRARGLSEEHFNALFDGEKDISTREALLISQIQHLEGKVYALASIMDEIASMKQYPTYEIAEVALQKLVTPRSTKGEK